jgi:hypothetical protein
LIIFKKEIVSYVVHLSLEMKRMIKMQQKIVPQREIGMTALLRDKKHNKKLK